MPIGFSKLRTLILEQLESRVVFDAAPGAELAEDAAAAEAAATDQVRLVEAEPSPEQAATLARTRRELIVVDPAVEELDTLLSTFADDPSRRFEVLVLDQSRSGVDQIGQTLADRSGLAAIHILSHGEEGAIRLGSDWLTADTLAGQSGAIAGWGSALTAEADLLLYGCDVAGSAAGRELVDALAALTGADVAASDDDTGSAARGGDWSLEYARGEIDTSLAVSEAGQRSYRGLLNAGPAITLPASSGEVFLGRDFQFDLVFRNTSAQVGYAPFVDIVLPTSGVDGAAAPLTQTQLDDILDGLSFGGVDGFVKKTTVLTFGDDDGKTQFDALGNPTSGTGTTGTLDHPIGKNPAGDPLRVTGNTGDTLVVVELNFGSFGQGQPGGEVAVKGSLSELADLGTGLEIKLRSGFRYGNDEFDNADSGDPTLLSDTQTDSRNWVQGYTVTPKVVEVRTQGTGDKVTGPNYLRTYTTSVEIAPGQSVTDIALEVDLPDDIVFDGYTLAGAVTTGTSTDNSGTLSTTGPAAGQQLRLTGLAATAGTVSLSVRYWVAPIDAAVPGVRVIPELGEDDGPTSKNEFQSRVIATWTPTDSRDLPAPGNVNQLAPAVTTDHKAVDVARSFRRVTDSSTDPVTTAAGEVSPGDVLENRIVFDVSDYFTHSDLVVDDTVEDGPLFVLFAETLADGSGGAGGTSERQRLSGTNVVDYTVTYGSQTTAAISKSVTDPAVLQAALDAIAPGVFTVTGSNRSDDPFVVTFGGSQAGIDQRPLILRSADPSLDPTVVVSDRYGTREARLSWRFTDEPDNGETFVIDRSDISRLDDATETGAIGGDATGGQQTVQVRLSEALVNATGGAVVVTETVAGSAGTLGVGAVDETQTLSATAAMPFVLQLGAERTATLRIGATAAEVKAALEALASVDSVTVTGDGTVGSEFAITFGGAQAGTDVGLLVGHNMAGVLTGGAAKSTDDLESPAARATATVKYYTVVQEEFSDRFPTQDRSSDQGDRIDAEVEVSVRTRACDDPVA